MIRIDSVWLNHLLLLGSFGSNAVLVAVVLRREQAGYPAYRV